MEKKEKYLGLQKFKNPEEAFTVMSGIWGRASNTHPSLYLTSLNSRFENAIKMMAIRKFVECKKKEISWQKRDEALGRRKKRSHYLLDFDFILYSKHNNCFYTNRTSPNYQWNDQQWGYYDELSSYYDFPWIIDDAKLWLDDSISFKKTDDGFDEGDELYDLLLNEAFYEFWY